MKVLFSVNYPLSWVRGGFGVQVRQSQLALEKQGVAVEHLDFFTEKAQAADVLHCFGPPASLSMYRAAHARGMKRVISFLAPSGFHTPSLANHTKRMARWLALRTLGPLRLFGRLGIGIEQADAFILLNEAEKNYVVFMYGWPENSCHIVHNGVDDAFFDETIPPESTDALLYPAYICPLKNQVEVARIAKASKRKVVFVGGSQGEYPEYAKAFERELDGKYAVWLGEIHDRRRLAALYRGSWGAFLASDKESQPLILLEALACGRPVMGPDKPSVRSYFKKNMLYCVSAKSPRFPSFLLEFDHFCRNGGRHQMHVPSWDDVGRRLTNVYKTI